jgi:hypothetical protein
LPNDLVHLLFVKELVSVMCFGFVQFDLQASKSKDPKAVDYLSDPISEGHASYFNVSIEIKGHHL